MRKVVFVLIALIAFNAQAQSKGSQNKSKMTPEEMATKRTDQMTKDLDLTETQQKDVLALNLKNAETFSKFRGKKRSDFSEEERKEMRSKMKAAQVENQNAMKEILTDEQYTAWDKMQKERMEKAKSQRGNPNNQQGNSKKNKKQ